MSRYKQAHGWTEGGRFFLSMSPRAAGTAANAYASPADAMRDAQARKLVIRWEDSAAIDAELRKR